MKAWSATLVIVVAVVAFILMRPGRRLGFGGAHRHAGADPGRAGCRLRGRDPHGKPDRSPQLGLDRGAHLDRDSRCHGGWQDHGHRSHGRNRAERALRRSREAQLRAGWCLRRHRPRARRRPLHADHQARAGGRIRAQNQPHAVSGNADRARRDLPDDARGRRSQPVRARFREHHLHRRQRREPGGHGRGGGSPQRALGRDQGAPHRGVL